jgi:hypothetical protein
MNDYFIPKHVNFQVSEAKKTEGRYCCAYGCRKQPNDKKKGMCHSHYQRYRRIIDPIYDRYVNFKGNALRRGKEFTITLQEFRDFCQREGYIICKGKRGRNCTIDRIENQHGYHIWNIQILSIGANIKKYHNEDKHFTELPPTDEDFVPF